jgi:hypothetical protein
MKKILTLFTLTLHILVCNSQTTYVTVNDSFESNSPNLFIDTALKGNLWQVGKPNKFGFNSSHSLSNCIITDSTNPYPINNHSEFIYKFDSVELLGTNINEVSFWHRYDMDTLKDWGWIEVSYNKGLSWQLLKDTSREIDSNLDCERAFWGAGDGSNKHGFGVAENRKITGTSSGWQKANFTWYWYPSVKVDQFFNYSIWLKFVFQSDSINNPQNGWMIDDIVMTDIILWGIDNPHENKQDIIKIYPIPASTNVVFETVGLLPYTLEIFDIRGRRISSEKVNESRHSHNTESLSKGLYLWKTMGANGNSETGKLLIE